MDEANEPNAKYKKFVEETEYVRVAEREIDWEEMKKQLPPNTTKPHDSLLYLDSLIFKKQKKVFPISIIIPNGGMEDWS